ncbi:hypothetical protein [Faecalibaculum rodentium]|uniref:hypothetical protein n=2 Tax=Faecalibaculum rodentium TaxID=1702221 RepID=UPI002615269F|nr:hypothetical protein [Faecalibaculum rodentium]
MNYSRIGLVKAANELEKFGIDPAAILEERLKREAGKDRVDPIIGENYWTIDNNGHVCGPMTFDGGGYDLSCLSIGNAFRTEQAALDAVDELTVRHLLLKFGARDYFKEGYENWLFGIDPAFDDGIKAVLVEAPVMFGIYFDSLEEAAEVIGQVDSIIDTTEVMDKKWKCNE